MPKRFDSDAGALRTRAGLNAARAAHDLEAWMLGHIPPLEGRRVLDLGCGTGKQVFRFAPMVTASGSILGIDVSAEAVRSVNDRAAAEGLAFVEARQGSLDDCAAALAGSQFDLVLSTYAIYYARDVAGLLRDLRPLLSERGTVFVCGPGEGTNREMRDLVAACLPAGANTPAAVTDFLSPAAIASAAAVYGRSQVVRLANQVRFESAQDVLAWWSHHNSFVPEAADAVRQRLETHFASEPAFALTKNVLGVRLDV